MCWVTKEMCWVTTEMCWILTPTFVGQNPFFDESFTFYTHFPEMALLKFTVLDDEFIGDEFIAQYTIPVDCINTG